MMIIPIKYIGIYSICINTLIQTRLNTLTFDMYLFSYICKVDESIFFGLELKKKIYR